MQPLIPHFDLSSIPLFGSLSISGFGTMVALGLLVGLVAAARKARRDGLDAELLYRSYFWVIASVFIGGHIGEILLYRPGSLISSPSSIFQIWDGLSSFGGFVTFAIFTTWIVWRENRRRRLAIPAKPTINIWGYGDAGAYGFAIGWFFGRIGCFSVHDHPSLPTDFWLGVYGICPDKGPDVACHDLGFYEAIWSFFIFLTFVLLERKQRFSGHFIGILLVAYAPTRFFLDFLRHPLTDIRYLGLTPAQYGSLVLLVLGIWMLWFRSRFDLARTKSK